MSRPVIRKLGTIECDLVESTPVVFGGRLYRFEYVRGPRYYRPNTTGDTYFRFVDAATGDFTPGFAPGRLFGSAHVEGGTAYAWGVPTPQEKIEVFWSDDLANWSSRTALDLPGWGICNTSVCRGPEGFVMAFEVGEPAAMVGHRFTNFFALSDDLLNWTMLDPERYVFARDRYTACPCLRCYGGWYYLIYLEALPAVVNPSGATHDYRFEEYLARSRDLLDWELSPLNPVLAASEEDRLPRAAPFTPEELQRLATATNRNNSDIDLCEFEGRTVIYYSWGSQEGVEHLAEAVYDGPPDELLRGFFPEP